MLFKTLVTLLPLLASASVPSPPNYIEKPNRDCCRLYKDENLHTKYIDVCVNPLTQDFNAADIPSDVVIKSVWCGGYAFIMIKDKNGEVSHEVKNHSYNNALSKPEDQRSVRVY